MEVRSRQSDGGSRAGSRSPSPNPDPSPHELTESLHQKDKGDKGGVLPDLRSIDITKSSWTNVPKVVKEALIAAHQRIGDVADGVRELQPQILRIETNMRKTWEWQVSQNEEMRTGLMALQAWRQKKRLKKRPQEQEEEETGGQPPRQRSSLALPTASQRDHAARSSAAEVPRSISSRQAMLTALAAMTQQATKASQRASGGDGAHTKESAAESSEEDSDPGLTHEERARLARLAPMEQRTLELQTSLKALREQVISLKERLDKTASRQAEMLVQISSELSEENLRHLGQQVMLEELPAWLCRCGATTSPSPTAAEQFFVAAGPKAVEERGRLKQDVVQLKESVSEQQKRQHLLQAQLETERQRITEIQQKQELTANTSSRFSKLVSMARRTNLAALPPALTKAGESLGEKQPAESAKEKQPACTALAAAADAKDNDVEDEAQKAFAEQRHAPELPQEDVLPGAVGSVPEPQLALPSTDSLLDDEEDLHFISRGGRMIPVMGKKGTLDEMLEALGVSVDRTELVEEIAALRGRLDSQEAAHESSRREMLHMQKSFEQLVSETRADQDTVSRRLHGAEGATAASAARLKLLEVERRDWADNLQKELRSVMRSCVDRIEAEHKHVSDTLSLLFPRLGTTPVDEMGTNEARLFTMDTRIHSLEEQVAAPAMAAQRTSRQGTGHIRVLSAGHRRTSKDDGLRRQGTRPLSATLVKVADDKLISPRRAGWDSEAIGCPIYRGGSASRSISPPGVGNDREVEGRQAGDLLPLGRGSSTPLPLRIATTAAAIEAAEGVVTDQPWIWAPSRDFLEERVGELQLPLLPGTAVSDDLHDSESGGAIAGGTWRPIDGQLVGGTLAQPRRQDLRPPRPTRGSGARQKPGPRHRPSQPSPE